MKQAQAQKEKPCTNDKFKTFAVRVPEWLHSECLDLNKGRGSAWARKVLIAAIYKELVK